MSVSEINTEVGAEAYGIWSGEAGDLHNAYVGGDFPVFLAIQSGDLEAVRGFLDLNPEHLNMKGLRGETPLQLARRLGESEIVRELLKRGADPALGQGIWSGEAGDEHNRRVGGDYPVILAIEAGDIEAVRGYLDLKPEQVNMTGDRGETPLQVAMRLGRDKIAIELVARGADPTFRIDPNRPGPDGKPPLLSAIERGDTKAIRFLVRVGASVTDEIRQVAEEKGLSDLLDQASKMRLPLEVLHHWKRA